MSSRPSPAVHGRMLSALAEAPLTFGIAAACLAVLAWVEAHGSSHATETLVRFGALERGRVWSGELWRLVTAPFLHAGWIHLAWNVAAGVPWCRPVERVAGPWRFLVIYLASAVGASALSLLGQDVVSVGASGALFGVVGATLALHRRSLGSWRAFLGSGPARRVVVAIAIFSGVGGLLLPLDQLAHAGGLAVGAAAAWLLSRPAPARALPWVGFAAALAALTVAAAWPRGSMTRFEGAELETALNAALRAHETGAARGLVARAEAGHRDSERLRLYRALLLVQEEDLGGAIDLARRLRGAEEPWVREEATRLTRELASMLAYRHREDAPWLADLYWEEACGLGDAPSCAARAAAGR